jgi:outer membrane protein OmpA-like peptidoglycan-associated protein
MKSYIITLFVLFLSFGLNAQQRDVEFKKENFPNDKAGLKEALKNIERGDEFYYGPTFLLFKAADFYLLANAFNPNNAEINFRIGISFLNSPNKFKALPYLNKAYEINPNIDALITYRLAEAFHYNHDFDNAIKYYNLSRAALQVLPPEQVTADFQVDKKIEECNTGRKLVANPARVIIDNVGSTINTRFREYSPVISADESVMFFTSRRDNTTGLKVADDGMYFEDIYMSTYQNNRWTPPVNLPAPVNTKTHDAVIAINSDGSKLFIYTPENEGDILSSTLQGETWTKPEAPGGKSINTKYSEIHACFSSDERSIYFVSNKPDDSYGGFDIFVTRLGVDGQWSKAENLGPTINTPYDEEGVYLHPDGKTMYFSSKGHNTMGSYDIFKSEMVDGKWGKPENLGYPINSADKDAFFVVSASGKHGYYSSAKMDAIGETDIYIVYLLGPEKETEMTTEEQLLAGRSKIRVETMPENALAKKYNSAVTLVKGVVVDAQTKLPLNAIIVITDNEKNEVVSTFQSNSKTGKYLVTLPSGKNYGIAVTMEDYLFFSDNFDIPASSAYQEVEKNIELSRLEVGKKIVLRNIFFDFNKSTLRPASVAELERLTKLLTDNPKMRIEISGHTDNVGSATYNQKLSQSRANAVVDYLIDKKGIKKDRLEFAGYGFTQPIADNDSDAGRQLNRRTEFKILSK